MEYQGLCKFKKIPHGNSTRTSVPYVRTDPALVKKAARITKDKHQKPLKTSHQMLLDDSINATNTKQIRGIVYRDTTKTDNGQPKLHIIVDELLSVLNVSKRRK